MIDIYRHVFFKPAMCDLGQWRVLLRGHPHADQMLAALQNGPEMAFHGAGVPMNPKPQKAVLESTLDRLYFRLVSLRSQPTTKATIDSEVKLAAEIGRQCDRLFGSSETNATEQLMAFCNRIELKGVANNFKTLEQLTASGRTYSGCGRELAKTAVPRFATSEVADCLPRARATCSCPPRSE